MMGTGKAVATGRSWLALGEEAGMGELGEGGGRTYLADKVDKRVLGSSSAHVSGERSRMGVVL